MRRGSRRSQRGFLYLTTGANGSAKTLFTLRDVRDLQLETSRPVFYTGFTPKQPIHDFGWKEFEPEKWQDLPDGSICIIDECQIHLPTRAVGKPPEWIGKILEVHRKRGFDFFLITQHPLNIDSFIRRAIASPGWHRHFKASIMGDSSNELKWASVVDNPQKPGSGDAGFVQSRKFDKEVYTWYESASAHTAKKKIPAKVWFALAAVVAAVAMTGYVVWSLINQDKAFEQAPSEKTTAAPVQASAATTPPGASEKTPVTPAQYAASYRPRINGLEHTAPAYDALTAPKVVPLPAACIQWAGKGCKCFTQRGTPYNTTAEICVQIVKHGIFLPFEQEPSPQPGEQSRGSALLVSGDNTGTQSSAPVARP